MAANGFDGVLDVLGQRHRGGVDALDQRALLGVALRRCGALVRGRRLAAPERVLQRRGVGGVSLMEAGLELAQSGVGGPYLAQVAVVLVPQPIKLAEQAGRKPGGGALVKRDTLVCAPRL